MSQESQEAADKAKEKLAGEAAKLKPPLLEPEIPEVDLAKPEIPDASALQKPELPSAPFDPVAPGLEIAPPELPKVPEVPKLPELEVPKPPALPELPKVPQLPELEVPKPPAPPELPKAPQLPEAEVAKPPAPPEVAPVVAEEPAEEEAATSGVRFLRFQGGGLEEKSFFVRGVQGRDAISSPYRFEIDLLSSEKNIDLDALLSEPACLVIKRKDLPYPIFGVLSAFEQLPAEEKTARYRAVLVPTFWRLSLTERSRIFQDMSIDQIVQQILVTDYGFTPDQFKFSLKRKLAPREFVVQYQESDLDFVSRWLEHEGISYYFAQLEQYERIVFTDHEFGLNKGEPELPYKAREGTRRTEEVTSFFSRQSAVPAKVVLSDYNWRTPQVPLVVRFPKEAKGVGEYTSYGEHFKDPKEGEVYARIRYEMIRCHSRIFHGESNCAALCGGEIFTLYNHDRMEFNRKYLLVEVRHRATQAALNAEGESGYANEFVSIPWDVEPSFRPERLTPCPRVQGTLTATVDGGGSGESAEIDDQGRYKVKLPWDLSGKGGGTASRFVRKSEPFMAPGRGMHFPLSPGAEVMLAFTNGDPDRPYIAGAIANGAISTPVAGGNATQCVIHAASGNQITLEDSPPQIKLFSPPANTTLALGTPEGGGNIFLGTDGTTVINTKRNFTSATGGDESWSITGHVTQTIGKDQTVTVTGNVTEKCDGARSETTTQDKWVQALANCNLEVIGNFESTVHANSFHTVVQDFATTVTGNTVLDTKGTITIDSKTEIIQNCPKWTVTTPEAVLSLKSVTLTTANLSQTLGTVESIVAAVEEQIGIRDVSIKKLSEDILSLDRNVKKLTDDVKVYNLSADKFAAKAKGSLELSQGGGKLEVKGGKSTLKGSKVDISGSKVNVKGSTLVVG